MRRLWLTLWLLVGLGTAAAQTESVIIVDVLPQAEVYAGASFGVIVALPGLNAHVGVENVAVTGLGFRADLGAYFPGLYLFGVNILYSVRVSDTAEVYFGAGPRLLVASSIGFGSSSVNVAGGALFGAEVGLQGDLSIFIEAKGDVAFDPSGPLFFPTLAAGANIRFR